MEVKKVKKIEGLEELFSSDNLILIDPSMQCDPKSGDEKKE
jgi:hypothetical protein